jgi:hypothetical protein
MPHGLLGISDGISLGHWLVRFFFLFRFLFQDLGAMPHGLLGISAGISLPFIEQLAPGKPMAPGPRGIIGIRHTYKAYIQGIHTRHTFMA